MSSLQRYEGKFLNPGIGSLEETVEANIFFGNWTDSVQHIFPMSLDGDTVDSGHTNNTGHIRPGFLLGRNESTKQYGAWDPTAENGLEIIAGINVTGINTSLGGSSADRLLYVALPGARIKASELIIPGQTSKGLSGKAMENLARALLTQGGFTILDDPYHKPNLFGGWRPRHHAALGASAGTEAVTVVRADHDVLFTNKGSDTALTFTLPAVASSAGLRFGFVVYADQSVTVASAEGGNIIAFNDVAANSVALSTAGDKVGAFVEVIGLDNAKWLVIPHTWADGVIVQTLTIAT